MLLTSLRTLDLFRNPTKENATCIIIATSAVEVGFALPRTRNSPVECNNTAWGRGTSVKPGIIAARWSAPCHGCSCAGRRPNAPPPEECRFLFIQLVRRLEKWPGCDDHLRSLSTDFQREPE